MGAADGAAAWMTCVQSRLTASLVMHATRHILTTLRSVWSKLPMSRHIAPSAVSRRIHAACTPSCHCAATRLLAFASPLCAIGSASVPHGAHTCTSWAFSASFFFTDRVKRLLFSSNSTMSVLCTILQQHQQQPGSAGLRVTLGRRHARTAPPTRAVCSECKRNTLSTMYWMILEILEPPSCTQRAFAHRMMSDSSSNSSMLVAVLEAADAPLEFVATSTSSAAARNAVGCAGRGLGVRITPAHCG